MKTCSISHNRKYLNQWLLDISDDCSLRADSYGLIKMKHFFLLKVNEFTDTDITARELLRKGKMGLWVLLSLMEHISREILTRSFPSAPSHFTYVLGGEMICCVWNLLTFTTSGSVSLSTRLLLVSLMHLFYVKLYSVLQLYCHLSPQHHKPKKNHKKFYSSHNTTHFNIIIVIWYYLLITY